MVIQTGEQMKAADLLNMVFFPKGTVLMFSGTDYTKLDQDVWKLCDGQGGRPNLLDKFVRGSSTSGSTGGGTAVLTEMNLPAHFHLVVGTALSDGAHNHGANGWGGEAGDFAGGDLKRAAMKNNVGSALTTTWNGAHAHTIEGIAQVNATHMSLPFSVVPAYYTLVYIIKVTDAGQ